MNEKQFEELREHLDIVMPDISNFCLSSGYEIVNSKSLGRYPRVRVEKKGSINYWIELWMELDEHGMRYTHFFDEIPYELSAGASVDIKDNSKYGYRYKKSFSVFSHKKFKDVVVDIAWQLIKVDEKLIGWSEGYLIEHGEKIVLG